MSDSYYIYGYSGESLEPVTITYDDSPTSRRNDSFLPTTLGREENMTSRAHQDNYVTAIIVIILVTIISSAVLGNTLVIISVLKFDKLRIMTNAFIVSLAFADLLVAILVMPFSASQEIAGKWLFPKVVCDIFNANDVLFCTASLLHLCCISMDRYIAITDPFRYERRMTRMRAAVTLCCVWSASALISHIPVHRRWYAKKNHTESIEDALCTFKVNVYYGIISSSVSFWTPALIMVFTYIKIYSVARRQEKLIAALANPKGRNYSTVTTNMTDVSDHLTIAAPVSAAGVSKGGGPTVNGTSTNGLDHESQRLTSHGRKMKREHKAAKTLGIIMGAFLVCWLPFFTWYLTDSICQGTCDATRLWISALFWIGYTNSALNPVIYACFNRDFRFAFKKLLFCWSRPKGHQYLTTAERTALKLTPLERNSISFV